MREQHTAPVPDCFALARPSDPDVCVRCKVVDLCKYVKTNFVSRVEVISKLEAVLKKEGPSMSKENIGEKVGDFRGLSEDSIGTVGKNTRPNLDRRS